MNQCYLAPHAKYVVGTGRCAQGNAPLLASWGMPHDCRILLVSVSYSS